MPELLLEVGTEELPASAVSRACAELAERIGSALSEEGILGSDANAVTLGTPRRMIVSYPNVSARQPDRTKEQRGPGFAAAYGLDGAPTQALLGFCRSQGVETLDLRNDGQYVWVTKKTPGRESLELLAEILPKSIRSLTFDKTMRWGSSRLRFARPIRWLLATLNGVTIPFEIEGIQSGARSRGHRFYAPGEFEATNLAQLVEGLRDRKVEPDPAIRRAKIVEGAKAIAQGIGVPDLPTGLVDENTHLTEWPTPIMGEFHSDYLELPASVLVTAMAKHEKMFPIRNEAGELTNRFVFVRNSGEDDAVRKGCQWVLNARFNDAKFFFEEDRKHTLDGFLAKTEGILFQEKLGTVRQRADRLSKLAAQLAPSPEEADLAALAGKYAKADLSTGLVSELTSLQGIIGGEYARRETLPEAVCWALSTQYDLAKNPEPNDAASRTAVRLVMADQLDKLAGYLGIGLAPSGSSDPFALRRAVSLLIEAALSWPTRLTQLALEFQNALALYDQQGIAVDSDKATSSLCDLFAWRYQTIFPDVRHDVLQAALLNPSGPVVTDPQSVRFRIRALEALIQDVPFVQTATRPMNIVIAARKKQVEFGETNPLSRLEHSALESAPGLDLFEILAEQDEVIAEAARDDRTEDVLRMLRRLQDPINRFFEETMVMVDEPDVRYARLTLLHATSLQLLNAGDFTKIVVEG
jgi:glycyl-tRNA synthetase beta chain